MNKVVNDSALRAHVSQGTRQTIVISDGQQAVQQLFFPHRLDRALSYISLGKPSLEPPQAIVSPEVDPGPNRFYLVILSRSPSLTLRLASYQFPDMLQSDQKIPAQSI